METCSPQLSATIEQTKRDLIRCIEEQIGTDEVGEIMLSGIDTLCRRPIYTVGLNPAPGEYKLLSEYVRGWNLSKFSAYLDQCWRKRCWTSAKSSFALEAEEHCKCPRNADRGDVHQKRVRGIAENLFPRFSLREAFSTQAVFMPSVSADRYRGANGESIDEAFEDCWPVHQLLLSVVQPKIILCLGYGESRSSYAFFRKRSISTKMPGIPIDGFKYFDAEFELQRQGKGPSLKSLVIGIPHPSRPEMKEKDFERMRSIVDERLECWAE